MPQAVPVLFHLSTAADDVESIRAWMMAPASMLAGHARSSQ
jgi:truncated hemoglobin YjbI